MSDNFRPIADLADQLAIEPLPDFIRYGTVTAVNSGPPVTVTVDGRRMRCLHTYNPDVGHNVIYLSQNSKAFCLGTRL